MKLILPPPINLVHWAPSLVITVSYLAVMVVYVLPASEMLFSLVPVVKLVSKNVPTHSGLISGSFAPSPSCM